MFIKFSVEITDQQRFANIVHMVLRQYFGVWLVVLLSRVACKQLDQPEATLTPYNKSRQHCYGSVQRNHDVALTTLLPSKVHIKEHMTDNLLRTLPNLLTHTPADIVMFHNSNWTAELIDGMLPSNYSNSVRVVCIATEDWLAPRKLETWENIRHSASAGYRSMCRWNSNKASRHDSN